MKNNKKGFTIVELVIVIAVIAILAGVLIPTFSGIVKKAKQNAALQEVKAAYTTYLSDALTDTDANTPVDKIYVLHDTVGIKITNGSAEVVESKPDGYTEMVVKEEAGKDTTLEIKS